MSKKRVHELAKQLKEQGIELSNNELLDKLHTLGYSDVKNYDGSWTEYGSLVGVPVETGTGKE